MLRLLARPLATRRGTTVINPPPRRFHLSRPLPVVHPLDLAVALAKPVIKISAVVVGVRFRLWYQKLGEEERRRFRDDAKRNWGKIGAAGAGFYALLACAYLAGMENLKGPDGITRRRFMLVAPARVDCLGRLALRGLVAEFRARALPADDAFGLQAAHVTGRILLANSALLGDADWTVTAVADENKFALVLPGGDIFVCTGLKRFCSGEDDIGIVVSHEMAHCLLGHVAEKFSRMDIMALALLPPLALAWAAAPTVALAVAADCGLEALEAMALELPLSRRLELEADAVGLELAARACLDVRAAPAMWARLEAVRPEPSWRLLQTHPSCQERRAGLEAAMAGAVRIRQECGCEGA